MEIVKKVVAVIVMILSVVLLLAMLAGVAGAWWGQGQLKGIVVDVSTAADAVLERSQAAVGQLNTVVGNTQGRVNEVVANIEKAGTNVEQTTLVLVAAERLLDTDLTPAVERVTQTVSDIRDTVTIIESTIRLWQRLPGARDNELLATADTAVQKIRGLQQAVADTRTQIQTAKSQITAEAVGRLTTPLDRVSGALSTVGADLAQLDQRIDAEQAQLATLTSQVLTAITIGAVVLTFAFLWMALAQLGLFVHAYGIFTGRDPLARWHNRKGQGASASVPQATGVA
jgi:signal transduction histidine kinase